MRVDRFRYDDGEEAEREIVAHPGAVPSWPTTASALFLVRQPREAVGEPALLELPAGKLDEEGEEPLETGQARAGRGDRQGRRAPGSTSTSFYTSPGFADEECHLFLATDLFDESAEADENERIEIVEVPLARPRRR